MSFGQVWQNASEKIWVHDKEKTTKNNFSKTPSGIWKQLNLIIF